MIIEWVLLIACLLASCLLGVEGVDMACSYIHLQSSSSVRSIIVSVRLQEDPGWFTEYLGLAAW